MKYTLKVYETEDGHKPLMKWLRGLKDSTARTAIRLRLNRLELGNFGHCRSVGEGVSELKIDVGPGYRVYYGMVGLTVVLLISGGDKKTQNRDIERAREFFQNHKEREKRNA